VNVAARLTQIVVRRPDSLAEAAAALAELGDGGEALAGGTWIMRAWLRGERFRREYVSLRDIPDLGATSVGPEVSLGAMATHTAIAGLQAGPAFECVRQAAAASAFPQVRNVATVGGNLGAAPFPEADLVPAMLAAEASLELHGAEGHPRRESVEQFLLSRDGGRVGEVIGRVVVPCPAGRRSAFDRLTVRAAGEYAIVNVAVSADIDAAGTIREARLAVGSVEPVARLCRSAGARLAGRRLDDESAAAEAAEAAAAELTSRDGLDAPAWYRLAVLPALIRRTLGRLRQA
jgi:carbon-monoxide dehydrogenase medium subunit